MKPIECKAHHLFESEGKILISEWVYGYYFNHYNTDRHSIYMLNGKGSRIVDIKSVGQFTGILDKNGNKIYEGDIVKHKFRRIWQTNEHTSTVIWNETYCCFYLFDGVSNHKMRDDIIYEIIGNNYDDILTEKIKIIVSEYI